MTHMAVSNIIPACDGQTYVQKSYGNYMLQRSPPRWGTGITGLIRGTATLPQGNQELLVVRDKVGRPQVILG